MIKKNEIGRECSMYEERRSAYRVLIGELEERIQFGRSRRRWEDNIKMDF
jgi:hypothetical protein